MSDKVHELAAKLVVGADKAWWGHEHLETVIRAELKPLLDTAKIFYDARPYSIRHSDEGTALADELERWGRAKP